MESIKGTVEQIVFHNKSNGYTVAKLEVDGDEVTVVGNFDEINAGEYLKLTGFEIISIVTGPRRRRL